MGEVYDLRRAPSTDANLSGDFTSSEIKSAIKHLKPNKAAEHPPGVYPAPGQQSHRMAASVLFRLLSNIKAPEDMAAG